ncbi:MAG: hypothetical protein MZV70_68695 [Desulfobacterales bacterium]|nr:hypothetical protein [Desulfobacterales bacterium]
MDNSRILIACAEMVQDGRARGQHRRSARGGRGSGVDEREGHLHRPVLRGLGRLHGVRRHLPDPARAPSSTSCSSRVWRSRASASGASRPIRMRWPQMMIDHIDKKRAALGIMGERERKLFSMEDRRA